MTRLALVSLTALFFASVSAAVPATAPAATAPTAPRAAASALVDQQVEALCVLYARGASAQEIETTVARFDARASEVLARLSPEERASLEREIEQRVAGQLWGMKAAR